MAVNNASLEGMYGETAESTWPTSTLLPNDMAPAFNCLLFKLIGYGFGVIILCVVGVVGNMLSMLTFWPLAHENSMSLLLMSLAWLDTGVLLTYTVLLATPAFCGYLRACAAYFNYVRPIFGAYFWPLASSLHLASTWQVTLVTVHRYLAVCHPLQFNRLTNIRQTRFQILGICIGSVVYNIPRLVDDTVKAVPGGYVQVKTRLGDSQVYGYVYSVGLYYLFIYAVPFAALTYMTLRLIKALRQNKMKKLTQAKKDEDDLTLALVVVIVVYMVCQVLNPIRRGLALGLPYSSRLCGSAYSILSFVSSVGILVNSAANFFIFCMFGKRFRRLLVERLRSFRPNRVGVVTDSGTTERGRDT